MGGHYKQKRSGYKTSFEFGEEELTYSFDNSRAKVGGTVQYHKIMPSRTSYREIKVWWLRYAAVFTATYFSIAALYFWDANDMEMLVGTAYITALLFLCVCLFALLQRHGGMTSIPLDPVLFILHDGKQETILEEIMSRRQAMMKKKLANVDFDRPYFEEARKFRWLRDEEIITEQEYRNARQKIAAMRDKASHVPPGPNKVN